MLLESPLMGQELDREKMRERRKELGLNQTEAAKLAGFKGGSAVWSSIERGDQPNVTLATLAQIAMALGYTSADLLTPAKKKTRKRIS